MRRQLGILAACLLAGCGTAFGHPHAEPAPDLVIRARQAHVGDGRVLTDVVVTARDGRIVAIAPGSAAIPAGVRPENVLSCDVLLPGLVAEHRPVEPDDALSADPHRLATDLPVAVDQKRLLDLGVTALALSPGTTRLVAGRAGITRLTGDSSRADDIRAGAVVASLVPQALRPPLLFEPVLRVNADNPLPPARPQRPATPMAAAAELRRLLMSPALPWIDVRAGRVPLRVRARTAAEIGRALDVAAAVGIAPVIEGGDEAWKVRDDLARAAATVVLDEASPATAVADDLDRRSDGAGLLEAAGVTVALASPGDPAPDPLLLAASAVRAGLSRDAAIAGVTGRLARAAGGSAALLSPGSRADFAGFDGDPLAVGTRPAFVIAGGSVARRDALARSGDAEDASTRLLALRVGRVLAPRDVSATTVLMRGDRIAAISGSAATPRAARVLDLGPESVAVPGFVDAFSRGGLDPGAPPGGNARVQAADAIEAGHPTLERAIEAGVTSALAVPDTRGLILGQAAVIGSRDRRAEIPRDADQPPPSLASRRPIPDVIASEAGLVTWLDDGPGDTGPRQPRLKGLREMLQKAKGYHETWLRAEKKPEGDGKAGKGAGKAANQKKGKSGAKKAASAEDKPDRDPQLEPWRPVLAGKSRAFLRSGREDMMPAALDAFKGVGITPVLCGAEEADRIARDLAARGVTVILGSRPLRREDDRVVNVAAELRAQGVPVAFGSFTPGATEQLPLAVASLVREGLAAADALAGLTTTAAAACGQEASSGKLEAGARADVVVFDGDPMEPSSRVQLVVTRGRIAYPPELAEDAP